MFAPSVGPALRRYGCVCRVVINEDDADDGVDHTVRESACKVK